MEQKYKILVFGGCNYKSVQWMALFYFMHFSVFVIFHISECIKNSESTKGEQTQYHLILPTLTFQLSLS